MMKELLITIFYQPLYNGLIFLMDISPLINAGIAVVLLTIIIKLILFPLSKTAVVTQMRMRELAPQLEEIKKEYSDDKQEQAKATMALYKESGVNPFSSILLILIQLPIIFALYFVFLRSGLPAVDTEMLYSFVPQPEVVNTVFLGFINIAERSWPLAIAAAVTNFFQIRYSLPAYTPKNDGKERTFKDDFARSMNIQMRYVFPVIVLFIAYGISGAVALYWTTSNLFTIGQELYIRKRIKGYAESKRPNNN